MGARAGPLPGKPARTVKNLRKFADHLHQQTGANFFVDITYNPGRRSRTVNIGEIFVARLRLQWFRQRIFVENACFGFKHEVDMHDELGDPYGRGTTANRALANLLRAIAGKELLVTVESKAYTVHVPRDIAD